MSNSWEPFLLQLQREPKALVTYLSELLQER